MPFLLPTGKPHVSFSEIRQWADCPHQHKLHYVDHLDFSVPANVLEFGTAIHACCENYLKTRVIDLSIVKSKLDEAWIRVTAREDYTPEKIRGFSEKDKADLIEVSSQIMADVPTWLEGQFPGWQHLGAEEILYESISESTEVKFKGLIDGIIFVPTPVRGKMKDVIWIIDWKTSAWGWNREKRSNAMTQSQLILYKHFWSLKHGVDPKDVKCGFVILKKAAKMGEHCELIPVSVGPVSSARSLKVLNNAIRGIEKGIDIKNRMSCKYCEFKGTEYCT
jgi:hypothetical protein